MFDGFRARLPLFVMAFAACSKPSSTSGGGAAGSKAGSSHAAESAKKTPTLPPASTNTGPFAATIEGHAVTFGKARARLTDGGLEISLGDACVGGYDGTHFTFSIPPGPDGSYFAGTTIAVKPLYDLAGVKLKDDFAIDENVTRVTLGPFVAKKGTKIHGSLSFATHTRQLQTGAGALLDDVGAGTFDAEICDDPATPSKSPTVDDAKSPAIGAFQGKSFEVKSGIAYVFTDGDNGFDHVSEIKLFDVPGVTCGSVPQGATYFSFEPAGISSNDPLFGKARPAMWQKFASTEQTPTGFTEHEHGLQGNAWSVIDAFDFVASKEITGRVFAESRVGEEPSARMLGSFRVTICRMGAL